MQRPVPAFDNSSPLDSLVRKTSTRRVNLPTLTTTPPRPNDADAQTQYSPILHTRFRTASTGTALTDFGFHERHPSDAESTLSWGAQDGSAHGRGRSQERNLYGPPQYGALQNPDSPFQVPGARGKSMVERVYSQRSYDLDDITQQYRDSYRESWRTDETARPDSTQMHSIPSVVVSGEQEYVHKPNSKRLGPPVSQPVAVGRTPSEVQGTANFSHHRVALVSDSASESRKLEVYKRNQQRPGTAGSSHSTGRSPLSQYDSLAEASRPSTSMSSHSTRDTRRAASPALSQPQVQVTRPLADASGNRHHTPPLTSSRSTSPNIAPRAPRPASPVSLYSHYSYYPFESPISSPTSPSSQSGPPATSHLTPDYVPGQSHRPPPTPVPPPTPTAEPNSENPVTAQDYLQLGIAHHEANRLTESAACFERSATLNGGCGVGMLMWGLAQRHGWGCAQSESAGFRWLQRAAEVAVDDLEKARAGGDSGAVRSEMVLAIYEVGQSFYRGWGVEKDKKRAVSYFKVAARLGDPDAQQDLAFCLANGKGCKKDKKEAAKWYRAAVAQGVSDVGLAWIYKDKYQ